MRIERPSLTDRIVAFAEAGHGLVIGRPGVGKSYALAEVARQLSSRDVPVLLLPVDQLGGASEEDFRVALGVSGPVEEAFTELFSQGGSGLLIFDGFDAARNPEARARLLVRIGAAVRLASQYGWAVLVAVRTFDARKSRALLQLFSEGERAARSIEIPVLTDAELSNATREDAPLRRVLEAGGPGLQELARIPFYLWMLEKVVAAQDRPEAVGSIRTEVGLLREYWRVHVADQPNGVLRADLLRRVAQAMVDGSVLRIPSSAAYTETADEAWRDLLSAEVIKESGVEGAHVAFAHHILFDFAVSVLLIHETPGDLVRFLSEDDSRPLFLRPSLLYFFGRAWDSDRRLFWACFWRLIDADEGALRIVGRVLPPFVLGSEAARSEDLAPLLDELLRNEPRGAHGVLRVLQALQFNPPTERECWLELITALSRHPHQRFAWEAGRRLASWTEESRLTNREREQVTEAARGFFEWAWKLRGGPTQEWYDSFAGALILPRVIDGCDLEPVGEIVDRILALLEVPRFPLDYFQSLCSSVERLLACDVSVVARVYVAIFGHHEEDTGPTWIGGHVLRLVGTRRQDFSMCHYQLGRSFPAFLDRDLRSAAAVAVRGFDTALMDQRAGRYLGREKREEARHPFVWNGTPGEIVECHPGDWLSNREELTEMLGRTENRLTEADSPMTPDEVTTIFVANARLAETWRRYLRICGARIEQFAPILHRLACETPIVRVSTLEADSRSVGVLAAAFEMWNGGQRTEFERELMSDAYEPWQRNYILAAIEPEAMVTEAAKVARGEVESRSRAREHETYEPAVVSLAAENDELLRLAGIDTSHPEFGTRRELEQELQDLAAPWRNERPDRRAVESLVARLEQFLSQDRESLDLESMSLRVWSAAADCAEALSRVLGEGADAAHDTARTVLVLCARLPEPEAREDADERYTSLTWGSTARVRAAMGLPRLVRTEEDEELLELFAGLAASREPDERAVAALYAPHMRDAAPGWFHDFLEDRLDAEQNPTVAIALLRSVQYLPDNASIATRLVLRWVASYGESRELRRALADWIAYFAFRRGEEWAVDVVRSAAREISERGDLVADVTAFGLNVMTPDRISEPGQERFNRAVVEWIVELLSTLRRIGAEASGLEHDSRQAVLEGIHGVFDEVATRLYYNTLRSRSGPAEEGVSLADLRDYYRAFRPVLEAIVGFAEEETLEGMVPRTAHNILQLLNVVLPFDPGFVLEVAWSVSSAGSKANFHLDRIAVAEDVRLVEAAMADHRDVIAGESLEVTLRLLDLFADVGWPQALGLVWRLDEVFR